MMKITKLTNSFTIDNNGNTTQHALNTVTAYIGKLRDSVTFKDAVQNIGSATVDDITVNGQQMTSDNIETLLEELFFLRIGTSNSDDAGVTIQKQVDWMNENNKSASYINNRPYTKSVYSDSLVFPSPVCSGHIVEFYKESNLYRTYQWNGWDWVVIGAEANFIFDQDTANKTPVDNLDGVVFYSKKENKYLITLESGKVYSDMNVFATKIDRVSKDYTLGNVSVYLNNENPKLEIESLKANNLSIQVQDYTNIKDSVRITSCDLYSYYFNVTSLKCVMQDILLLGDASSSSMIEAKGQNILIDNNQISYLQVSSIQPNKDVMSINTISIINNTTKGEDSAATVTINGNYNGATNISADITIKNNKNVDNINITSFNEDSKVNTLDLSFDEKLSSVQISSVVLTEEALSSLIKALVEVPKADVPRSFYYRDNSPVLTDSQKEQLIDTGWAIQE